MPTTMSDSVVFSPPDRSASLSRRGQSLRGQSLMEFGVLLPLLLLLVGGVVQFGALYAARHSLIQVGRDVGRWAATQQYEVCSDAATATPPQPVTEADRLAVDSGLFGYAAGDWGPGNFMTYPDNAGLPPDPPAAEGVEVVWSISTGSCPPIDSTTAAFVTVRLSHRVPVILPGFAYLPGVGTCDGTGCYIATSTTSEFRMEPHPAPTPAP